MDRWHFVDRQLVELKLCLINNFIDYDSLSTRQISPIIFLDLFVQNCQSFTEKHVSICRDNP